MPLQQADTDRLLIHVVQHTRAFTKNIDRANSRTTQPKNVRVDNRLSRALEITASDLLDEAWNVDVRGTSGRARGIETK